MNMYMRSILHRFYRILAGMWQFKWHLPAGIDCHKWESAMEAHRQISRPSHSHLHETIVTRASAGHRNAATEAGVTEQQCVSLKDGQYHGKEDRL